MEPIISVEEATSRLQMLFQKSGLKDEMLLSYIQHLSAENEQLKRNLHKIRTHGASKTNTTSSMHSKLFDALRE